MVGFLFAVVCGSGAWGAQGVPPESPSAEVPVSPSPRTRLEDALRHHLAGDHEQARVALVDLLNDDRVTDREIRIRARVYLGEVLFVEGNRDASWDAFAALLEDDPRYRLDPYEHPPDVMAFFETVRAARAEGRATLPAAGVPARVPLLAYAPFGAWQIANQEPWTGWTLATVQVASGVASLWLLADLTESHETRDPEVYDTMRLKRRLSWTATAVFYGAWLVGGIDAWSAARGTQPSRAAVQVVPLPDGLSVALAVRTP